MGKKKLKITLISRQNRYRSFNDDDFQQLETNILKLRDRYDVDVLDWEDLSIPDQIAQASQTNIMIGNHGNGMTHALWMSPSSTVVEIYPSGSWNRNYVTIAIMSWHNHFGVWNYSIVRDPDIQWVDKKDTDLIAPRLHFGDDFNGENIPCESIPVLEIIERVAWQRDVNISYTITYDPYNETRN